MSVIKITVQAGSEQVTARLTGWRGDELDALHLDRIHETLDRALLALRVAPVSEPAGSHAHPS